MVDRGVRHCPLLQARGTLGSPAQEGAASLRGHTQAPQDGMPNSTFPASIPTLVSSFLPLEAPPEPQIIPSPPLALSFHTCQMGLQMPCLFLPDLFLLSRVRHTYEHGRECPAQKVIRKRRATSVPPGQEIEYKDP